MTRFFLFVLPLVGCFTMARAQTSPLNNADDRGQALFNDLSGESDVAKLITLTHVPLYNPPECDNEPENTRKLCADRAMLSFIYENIIYPEEALNQELEGMAVINFVVEEDGSLSNFSIIRDPGAGMGDEALRVAQMLGEYGPGSFLPGLRDGEVVRSEFNLPVKFRLR